MKFLILDEIEFFEILFEGRLKIIICCPKFIYYKKTRLEKEIKLSQISKATQSSESDTDFTQDITEYCDIAGMKHVKIPLDGAN